MSQSLFFPAQPYVRELEYQFERVVRQAGCDNDNDDQMACLRGKDTAVLQGANVAQPFPGRDDPPMPLFYWAPCVDGEILTDVPYRLFEKGEFIRVPMVVGTNANGESPVLLILSFLFLFSFHSLIPYTNTPQRAPLSPPTQPPPPTSPSSSATTTRSSQPTTPMTSSRSTRSSPRCRSTRLGSRRPARPMAKPRLSVRRRTCCPSCRKGGLKVMERGPRLCMRIGLRCWIRRMSILGLVCRVCSPFLPTQPPILIYLRTCRPLRRPSNLRA